MTTTVEPYVKDKNWWVPVLKGVLLIIFGIWLIQSPSDNLMKLSAVFGIVIILGGILELVLAVNKRKINRAWGWDLGSGIVDLLIGAFLLANPSVIFIVITTLVSLWLLIRGIMTIRVALMAKKADNPNYVYSLVFGILTVVLAFIFIWHPQILGITLAFWVALAFISLGIFRIIIGLKIRRM